MALDSQTLEDAAAGRTADLLIMKAKDVLGFVLPKYKSPSVCESCGGEFVCGAAITGCWCTEIKLSDETRADLRNKFDRCLCRNCLEALAKPYAELKYPNGKIEKIAGAVKVDTTNYHEGMYDFYDGRGNLLKQVDMGSGVAWEFKT